jgi:hypothetical protein
MFCVAHQAHYAAAKAGIFGLRNVIAIEGQAHGILANNVLPWGVTRMLVDAAGGEENLAKVPVIGLLEPDLVAPLVVYLASRACQVSHQDFSAAAGRYARVFTALGEGWLSEPGSRPTADDIAARFEAVSATTNFRIPFSVADEAAEICARRGSGA